MSELVSRNWAATALHVFEHPLFFIFIIALAVRFVIAPFLTYDYDIYHWGVIIQNFQSGNGLYEVAGYYYTPTWGYILGFLSMVQDALLNIDVFGVRITDLLGVETLNFRFHTATTTTIGFNLAMKIPLIIVDAVVAVLLYRLVREKTGSERKSTASAALWLFCPTVIYMSGVQAQFDCISALMMLVTVVLVCRDRCLLAGMVFGAAVLLKFFPVFTIFVMIAYLAVKHREDGMAAKRIGEAALGAVIVCVVLLLPQILDGTLDSALSFITGRLSNSGENMAWGIWNTTMIVLALVCMVFFGILMLRTRKEDANRMLFVYVTMALAGSMLMSVTPQYMIVMLPFLILCLAEGDNRLWTCWIILSAGSIIAAVSNNNFMLLDSASAFLGLVSPEWILSSSVLYEQTVFGGMDLLTVVSGVGGIMEYVGLFLMFALFFEKRIKRTLPRVGWALSKVPGWNL